jgi:hypothetical protein
MELIKSKPQYLNGSAKFNQGLSSFNNPTNINISRTSHIKINLSSSIQLCNSKLAKVVSANEDENVSTNNNNNNTTNNNNNNSNKQFDSNVNKNTIKKNSTWIDLNWYKIKKIGIGLYNLGNNC